MSYFNLPLNGISEEDLHGSQLGDPFREHIFGLRELMALESSGVPIQTSMRDMLMYLFPPSRKNVRDYLQITHPDKEIERTLRRHFAHDCSYSRAYNLDDFLERLAHLTLFDKTVHHSVLWEEKEYGSHSLYVPTDFYSALPKFTLKKKRKWLFVGEITGYKQKYSLLGRWLQQREGFKLQNRYIPKENVFSMTLPFPSPLPLCLPHKDGRKQYMRFMSDSMEGNTYPNKISKRLELARLRNSEQLNKRNERTEALIESFELNEQIMSRIRIAKHGSATGIQDRIEYDSYCLLEPPSLNIEGFTSDKEYREVFAKFESGDMTEQEFQKYQLDDM